MARHAQTYRTGLGPYETYAVRARFQSLLNSLKYPRELKILLTPSQDSIEFQ